MGHLDHITNPDVHDKVNREKNTSDAIKTFQDRRDSKEKTDHIGRNLEERGIDTNDL